MPTRGLWMFRHRGRYLIRYNHVGSFPDELGRKLVSKIPKEPAEYQKWKTSRQASLDRQYARYLKTNTHSSKPTKFTLLEESATPEEVEPLYEVGRKNEEKTYTWSIYQDGAWSEFPPEEDCMIEWVYVIDLDRDAFTVDWVASFNMLDWPEDWEDHIEVDKKGRRCVPTKLDKKHLVLDVAVKPPPIDEALLKRYEELAPDICNRPPCQNEAKESIILQLQGDLMIFADSPYDVVSKEWGINDIPMQKLVYLLVKFCCYESLEFQIDTKNRRTLEIAIPTWLMDADYPRGTEYYVPTGTPDKEILISLGTHLDQEDVMRMAVARVVDKLANKEDGQHTACIVSTNHVVIVTCLKAANVLKVFHTKPLELWGETSEGRKAMIALMSSPEIHNDPPVGPARAVSPMEVNQVFGAMCSNYENIKDNKTFHDVCKEATNVLHGRTLRFPERTLLTHKTWLDGCMYGMDDDGTIGLYSTSEGRYPLLWDSAEGGIKTYKVLVDGADFGIGLLKLIPVDVGNILDPKPQQPAIGAPPMQDLFPAGFGGTPVDLSNMFGGPR